MSDDLKGLPTLTEKTTAADVAKAVKKEQAEVAAANADKPAPKKLPDPANHDYTYGKPLGEKGKYTLPNGTVVETN